MICLFLAPMKPPDHPVPSGDRTIARNWMRILARLGWEVRLASSFRSVSREDGDAAFATLFAKAQTETQRILADDALVQGVSLVFCYHNYYRAPDCIGPELAARLGVPYVIAEPSVAGKRLDGPTRAGELQARKALAAARLVASATTIDRPALEMLVSPCQTLVTLPAGLDPEAWPEADQPLALRPVSAPLQLLTVAMMRAGAKQISYKLLADALRPLATEDWELDIHGDGPMRAAVRAMFAPFGSKVRFHGESTPATLACAYRRADLFVWPGWRESYGMVYLEAQLHGLPCLAGQFGGVADALAPDSVLIDPCTPETYGAALAELRRNRADLASRRQAVRAFVLAERSLAAIAARFAAAARIAGIPIPAEARR
jgi:glycosyltransferase involved in cell wall biosynthesis